MCIPNYAHMHACTYIGYIYNICMYLCMYVQTYLSIYFGLAPYLQFCSGFIEAVHLFSMHPIVIN